MKSGNRPADEYVDLLIDTFKKNRNLPYAIKSGSSCPDKKKNCRKKHGEVIVKQYDGKQKKFHVLYYSVHTRKPVFVWWQDQKTLKQMILKTTKKFSYGKKPLLRIKELKKLIGNKKNRILSEHIRIRTTIQEKENLIAKSKKKNMKLSDYVRKKLFP